MQLKLNLLTAQRKLRDCAPELKKLREKQKADHSIFTKKI